MDGATLLITLICVAFVTWLFMWLLGLIDLDANLVRALRIAVVVIALVYLILFLTGRAAGVSI